MQLKLRFPGEKDVPPPAVWHQFNTDARIAAIRAIAKMLARTIVATRPEAKGEGAQNDDGEDKNQLNALGSECNSVRPTIDSGSAGEKSRIY